MSGFDAHWLGLREPVDRRSRSAALADELQHWLATRQDAGAGCAIDLGCGTGANVRFLAPRLVGVRRWIGVDDAPALLASVARSLPGVTTETRLADLSRGMEALDDLDARVVTASALLDLVSSSWLDGLVAFARRHRAAALFALSYDGRLSFHPGDAEDEFIRAAFDAHQRRDKGFGPALGPRAVEATVAALRAAGYAVRREPSDWRLDAQAAGDFALIGPLVEGIAAAAREQLPGEAARVDRWLSGRRRQLGTGNLHLAVGHEDVLGLPADRSTAASAQ